MQSVLYYRSLQSLGGWGVGYSFEDLGKNEHHSVASNVGDIPMTILLLNGTGVVSCF